MVRCISDSMVSKREEAAGRLRVGFAIRLVNYSTVVEFGAWPGYACTILISCMLRLLVNGIIRVSIATLN